MFVKKVMVPISHVPLQPLFSKCVLNSLKIYSDIEGRSHSTYGGLVKPMRTETF